MQFELALPIIKSSVRIVREITKRMRFLRVWSGRVSLSYHSYLNATIGSSFEARIAGYIPKKMPIRTDNTKLTTTVQV